MIFLSSLYIYLKNFHRTNATNIKVYFKDSYGHTVRVFDSVQINELDRIL
jgi:hypothetical protein